MSSFDLVIRRLDDKELSDLAKDIRSGWPEAETGLTVELAPGITRNTTVDLDIPSNHNIINLTISIFQRQSTNTAQSTNVLRYNIIFSRNAREKHNLGSTLFTSSVTVTQSNPPDRNNNPNYQNYISWLSANSHAITGAIAKIQRFSLPEQSATTEAGINYEAFLQGLQDAQTRGLDAFQKAFERLDIFNAKIREEAELKEQQRLEHYEELRQDLGRREEELARSSHKSERRKLFDLLTSADNLGRRKELVSKRSIIARWAIAAISVSFGTISAVVSFKIAELIQSSNTGSGPSTLSQEYLMVKSILSAALATASFAFSASWIKSFYESDIEYTREAERLNADMIRANWAIETILEVQEEYKKDVSPELISSITKNLFEAPDKPTNRDDAALALKALLGFTASAKFGTDGTTVEINKKEARKLSEANKPDGA